VPLPSDAAVNLQLTDDQTLRVALSGDWLDQGGQSVFSGVVPQLEAAERAGRMVFDASAVTAWDSGLLTFLVKLIDHGQDRGLEVDRSGLPDGVQRLLNLAYAVPEKQTARSAGSKSLLDRIGKHSIAGVRSAVDLVDFIGSATVAAFNLLRGKARFRRHDFIITLQEAGFEALPIVSLITFLNGFILAFVGAIQLKQIGAELFVADLVGIATTRAMGCMMAGIVMAGRTGAAFAAQLGTMTANEEIDALETMGISPMEFLVLPRMLALALMMPILVVYADLMGIFGGMVVSVGMLELNPMQYLEQTQTAVRLSDFLVGLTKGAVFGLLIALSGCMRGMQCGRSASAVGQAATSAVVTGITALIVADAIFSIILDILGI
jgi:phospholipid/cholesterol/gamma-HCH transport system permease protein